MPLYGKIIVIKRTGADGYNFPLTSSSCLFGRKTDCDIRIQLPHVSKEHCKLEVNENNEVILTNLSEVNRTHLNSKVVLHSERLKHRDVFTIIDRSFRFEYPLDSVHNTSPRKRRSLSSLKNETLQVLHVQQGVDDSSQPSGIARRSTSGRKSDKRDVDKIFEAPTKSAKATPNERDGSAPKHQRKRSSTKILNDEQPTDEEYLSPFSKLYEIFKQEVTKPIQVKPNEINMHIAVKENHSDLTKQSGVPGKESDAAISQYGKNPRVSLSAKRMSGRRSNMTPEEGKIENNNEYEKMNNSETLLLEGIATADLAKPITNINDPNKNNILLELNKLQENASSAIMVTSPAFSNVGLKGKEPDNYLSPKCTPKTKHKSQDFNTRKSLTADEAVKNAQEMVQSAMEKEPSIVVKTVGMEQTPSVNVGKEKAETPKNRGRSSLRNKNVESTDIQSEQAEYTEPLAAKSVEMEHTAANVGKEKAETPKRRGRPSLGNRNVQPTEIQTEQAESTNVSELSAVKSVEMEHTAANVGKEKAETPKRCGRPSLGNKNVRSDVQSEQAESTNVSELSSGYSEVEDISVEMEHTAANVGKEKAETPIRRGRPSLRNKSLQPTDIQSEQAEYMNVSEPLAAKSVEMENTTANVVKEKAETPKRRGRPSLGNKNVQPTDIQSEQAEYMNVSELSAAKSVEMEHTAANVGEKKAETPKRRGRSSLPNTNVQSTDIWSKQAESAAISESSAATKSPALIKQKRGKSERFSSGDGELGLYTSSKESPSSTAAISHLSKKRRSENEENYGSSFKRKRVSFGVNLSPEVFDKRMPPSSPLRKGGTPTRVSTPFRCTPRTVLKRASSIGIHTCTIQEFSELNESPMTSNIPSAGASPKQTKKSPTKVPSPSKGSLSKASINPSPKRTPLVKMPKSTKPPSLLGTKQSPDAKSPLPTKTPPLTSTKRSPSTRSPLQNKTPSATKKLDVAKTLPTLSPRKLVASKMSCPITERSVDCSPRIRGRFSISHVATPPHLTRSKSPHHTPSSLDLVLFEQPQQKASLVATSGKKSSRKSTRRSGSLLAAGRCRRQTGASAANLLVTKSWAQIVKEGVARPQLRCARKKSAVIKKRTKKTSLKMTPVHSVNSHVSTGHAASPATIVIGRSQATRIKPTRKAPLVVRPVLLKSKDYDMDESFTGMAEMFSTPINENESTHPVLCTSSIVDDSQTALASPVMRKSFADFIKTPEETGVMAVSPLTTPDPRSSRKYKNSVSRLLRCRADFSSSLNYLCENIPQVPKVKGKLVKDVVDVKGTIKTPKVKGKPVEDMAGVKRFMKTPKVKGKPVEDMAGVKRIMKTPRIKGKPVEDMVGVKRVMRTPKVRGKPVEDMVGIKRIMKTPRVKEKPVENFTGLRKLMSEPKPKAESPEVNYVGVKNLFQTGKEMESCNYSGLAEMFSSPIKTEESSDSKQQQTSRRSANEKETNRPSATPEKMYSENKLSQIVECQSDQQLTENPPHETGGNSSLTSDVQVTREGQVRAKGVTSPSSKEKSKQQTEQLEASQMFPEDGHVDFSEREITESKDGQPAMNKLISPTRRSLNERKEMKNTGAEEFPTTVNAIPSKNGCSVELSEEVGKMASTRRSLTRKKINDAEVKMSLTPNKTTPGKREYPHEHSEEVVVLKPQTRGSLKGKGNFQNTPNVELKELLSSTVKSPTSSKNESPGKTTEEINTLVSPSIKSLRGKKKVQNVHINERRELFVHGKTTPGKKESQDGQVDDVNEITLVKSSLESKKESQHIQEAEAPSPPTSTKTCTQDEKSIPMAEVEEVVHTALRRTQRRKKETENIQATEVKKSPAVAKSSNGKKTQYEQIEKVDNSSLKIIMQEKNNVESGILKNGYVSPKASIKDIEEVKDHPVENVKMLRVGRPQRRKNTNAEETEAQPPGATNGYTRKRGARCARVENIEESIGSQDSLKDQEEVDKAGANSDPEESVRNGVKTENIKIHEKKDLPSSKSRSTRGKRGVKDLLLEELGQDSVPTKRLRKEELDEAPSKAVHWDPNIAQPKLADCTVETLQQTINETEPPVRERRSRRGNTAKKEVNLHVSVESGKMSRKPVVEHANSKVNTDAHVAHEAAEQKGRPKRNKKDILCEPPAVTKEDKYDDAENTNEVPPVMEKTNLSPTPIKRSLRGKVRQEVTQIKEEHIKEISSRNSKRNTRGQKSMAITGEEPHVPVRGASGKEEKQLTVPSSRTMEKGEQAKELLVECKAVPEQIEQQQTTTTVDVQLDTASKRGLMKANEPIAQKGKSKVCQRTKASPKGAPASLSNIDIAVGEMAPVEKRSHLNAPIGGSEVVDDSDIPSNIEATKQTTTKSKVSNTTERASDVTSNTKKTDVVSFNEHEIKENTRSKRGVGKGRSSKRIATESEVESLVLDTAEEISETLNLPKRASKASIQFKDALKTKSDGKKLPEPAISKRGRRKIVTEDAPSVPPLEEELQIEEAVDPVKAPRKGGRGMVKRNTSAVINQELSMDVTEKEQLSTANKAETNKRARRGQTCYDGETAITVVQDKRRKRVNPEAQINDDEYIQSRKDEIEDKVKDENTNFLSVESSKPARRATRANKSCEVATKEPISIQPLDSVSLKPASLCPSKRALRGKLVSAETSNPSPKKSKMEKVIEKVMTQSRKTTKAAVSTKKALPVTPQPAKPTGRSTRSRK
ncbi:proliferation marker protein Ki-67 isoform X2 [Mustelus asterias]